MVKTNQSLWDAIKAMISKKCIAFNANRRKGRFGINDLSIHFEKPEKN